MKTYIYYQPDGTITAAGQSVPPSPEDTTIEVDSNDLPQELVEFGFDACKVKNGKLVVDNAKAKKLNSTLQERKVLRNLIQEVNSLDLQEFLALPDDKKWRVLYALLTAAKAQSLLRLPKAMDFEAAGAASSTEMNPFPHGKPPAEPEKVSVPTAPISTPN